MIQILGGIIFRQIFSHSRNVDSILKGVIFDLTTSISHPIPDV